MHWWFFLVLWCWKSPDKELNFDSVIWVGTLKCATQWPTCQTRTQSNLPGSYLGLDSVLPCTLKKSAAKVNTLLRLLAGSLWRASATTLRTSDLALCYSTAEYCAPVCTRSPYTSWMNLCALSLELCTQHLFRGCQSSATSLPLTFGEWQQQINFSVRSGPQPSLCPWYQTSSPIRLTSRRPVSVSYTHLTLPTNREV